MPRTSWYLFNRPRKNETLSWPWSHTAVLNLGSLDWKSRTLTTRPYIVQFQWYTVRETDAFSAQSIFHSPRYTNLHSSFRTIKQNKSYLLVNNSSGCLILLAQKKSSQVVWFHSTSIFQHLFFYYLLESVAIYFQCYAFHGASIYDTFDETSNRDDYRTVEFLGTQFSVCFRKK